MPATAWSQRRPLIGFASAAHVMPLLCVRRSAPGEVEAPSRPVHWVPSFRLLRVDTSKISQLSRRSILCLCCAS
jgi:hypothetical protein